MPPVTEQSVAPPFGLSISFKGMQRCSLTMNRWELMPAHFTSVAICSRSPALSTARRDLLFPRPRCSPLHRQQCGHSPDWSLHLPAPDHSHRAASTITTPPILE